MASSLEQFLSVKTTKLKEKTIPATCKDGTEVEIDIRQLTPQEYQRTKAISTFSYQTPNGTLGNAQTEEIAFALNLAVAGIVRPNLNNVELRKHCDTHSSEGVVTGLFDIDEIGRIALEVSNLSLGNAARNQDGQIEAGVGTDPEKVKEAKN